MEAKKNKHKIIHIARLSSLDSSTPRQRIPDTGLLNIFNRNSLEASSITSLEKNYSLVGLTELQQFIKRGKKSNVKKFTNFSTLNLSLKSYTAKSNEPDDNLLTKEEVFEVIRENANSNTCSLPNYSKVHDTQKSKYPTRVGQIPKKFRIKNNRFSDKLDKYQEKVELLKKYTLHQKKQNIGADEWKNILRSEIGLLEIFDKNERNFQSIKRNGFKVVALSKKKKEVEWIESQKESTLYQFIQKKKNSKVVEMKPGRKNQNQLMIKI